MEFGKGGLIRSRAACNTCRIRHIKCDETKPSCVRCQKDGRKCDGYLNLRPRKIQSGRSPCLPVPRALPSLPDFDDALQRELFGSFVSCTTDASNLYFGANFWARRVLQLSLSEASIRYALCSLSALHRMSTALPTNQYFTAAKLRQYALQQYNQAVRCTQALLAESSDGSDEKIVKGLVACVLFVCYENFTGNYQISYMHLQNGLRIVINKNRQGHRSAIPKDIVQVLKRLDLQAITFGDANAPYPGQLCEEPIELLTVPPAYLGSIEDSIDVVLHLCRWLFRREAFSESCPIPAEDLESANKSLERWTQEVEQNYPLVHTKSKDELSRPMALLKMYQMIMSIIIVTGVHGQETLHDNYLDTYEEVITLAEALLQDGQVSRSAPSSNRFFCFDIGVIFPLFWVAIKCRKPYTRRQAAKLLGSMYHQEGAWKSTSAAKVAEFLINIEEEGMLGDGQIPETARVHFVKTTADVEKGEIRVSCLLRPDLDDSSWYYRDGRIPDVAELLPV